MLRINEIPVPLGADAEEIKAAMKEGPVTRSDMVAAAAAQNGMVTCPYCGTLTRAASFCQNCGGTLT